MNTKGLSISGKVFFAFALIGITVIVSGVWVYGDILAVRQATIARGHSYEVLETIAAAEQAMTDCETGIRGYVISGDTDNLVPYNAGVTAFGQAMDRLKSLTADNPVQEAHAQAIEQAARDWQDQVATKILHQSDLSLGKSEIATLAAVGGKTMFDRLRTEFAASAKTEKSLLAHRMAETDAALDTIEWVMIVASAISLVLCVVIWIGVQKLIVAPLVRLTAAMGRLAQSDLAVEIPETGRGDELGRIAGTVLVFRDNMVRARDLAAEQASAQEAKLRQQEALMRMTQSFADTIGTVVHSVSASSSQVRGNAERLNETADETARRSSTVAAAAEQATTNVQTVAAAAEQLTASIREISRQVSQASGVAAQAVGEANQTNTTVRGLAEAAESIGDVVRLINDIASQTNLLALNATIEAARAGEAGKGFAVVAAEVKNLAAQTAKATGDIQEQISAIQTETEKAVNAIATIAATIGDISQITTTVAAAVEEQGAATEEIARNVQQAAQGTNDVTVNIVTVNRAAATTGKAATEMLETAGELTRQSGILNTEVANFVQRLKTA